jgi:hypothetical protein
MRYGFEPHFDSNVARENSWYDSTPSWFRSSWSKILRAWVPSGGADIVSLDIGPVVAEFGVVDVPLDELLDSGVLGCAAAAVGAAVVLPVVPGVAATPRVSCGSNGCTVRVPEVAAGRDEFDAVSDAGFAELAVMSDVVAHAAPAAVMIEAATAVTRCLAERFIGAPWKWERRCLRLEQEASCKDLAAAKRLILQVAGARTGRTHQGTV